MTNYNENRSATIYLWFAKEVEAVIQAGVGQVVETGKSSEGTSTA